jgi:hypothetical protein
VPPSLAPSARRAPGPPQADACSLLLEKLAEYSGKECEGSSSTPSLILGQMRWLEGVVDSPALTDKVLQVLAACPAQIQKELIGGRVGASGQQPAAWQRTVGSRACAATRQLLALLCASKGPAPGPPPGRAPAWGRRPGQLQAGAALSIGQLSSPRPGLAARNGRQAGSTLRIAAG